ncbi:hypothetical protein BLNAU_24744 [Blattamonas nauphoetae]|uniref:Uncharacterized protein n=1 Tax=Blattamonas nauphoetae TaxID=2049346 RepID=A0ABQ9WLL2_9EUKA|nr:hypothetical protein BLNAU_24744 [Blattamonas nauphoetae]
MAGMFRHQLLLLQTPISKGITSVTITILCLPKINNKVGGIRFGLIDSSAPIPKLGELIGLDVKDVFPSVYLFRFSLSQFRNWVAHFQHSINAFAASVQGSSFRIDPITRLTQPSPIPPGMKEIDWERSHPPEDPYGPLQYG